MGRGVRPVSKAGIEGLSDMQLAAYIADTRIRILQMSKASLRNGYKDQLRLAEQVREARVSPRDAAENG